MIQYCVRIKLVVIVVHKSYIQLTLLVEKHFRWYFAYHWTDERISFALLFKRNNINFTILTEVSARRPCPQNNSNCLSNILGYIWLLLCVNIASGRIISRQNRNYVEVMPFKVIVVHHVHITLRIRFHVAFLFILKL